MSETVLERHFRDRMQSLQRLVSLPESERAALTWRDYKDLVALCVELSVSGREFIENEYSRSFKHENLTVAWLKDRRGVIEELSGAYLQLAQAVRERVTQARQAANSPNGKDFRIVLDENVTALIHAKDQILEQWAVGSPEEMAAAKAAIARGETEEAEVAFADIAGVDVERGGKASRNTSNASGGQPRSDHAVRQDPRFSQGQGPNSGVGPAR